MVPFTILDLINAEGGDLVETTMSDPIVHDKLDRWYTLSQLVRKERATSSG